MMPRVLDDSLDFTEGAVEVIESCYRVLVLLGRPAGVIERADDVLDEEKDGDEIANRPEGQRKLYWFGHEAGVILGSPRLGGSERRGGY